MQVRTAEVSGLNASIQVFHGGVSVAPENMVPEVLLDQPNRLGPTKHQLRCKKSLQSLLIQVMAVHVIFKSAVAHSMSKVHDAPSGIYGKIVLAPFERELIRRLHSHTLVLADAFCRMRVRFYYRLDLCTLFANVPNEIKGERRVSLHTFI